MRSGRGKCPQCKEMIVVDLDAPELRCPFCHALLKKSKKTPAEVRAEEEARIAATLPREEALAEEAREAEQVAAPVEEAAPAPVETPVEAPAEAPVEEPAKEPVAEEPATEEVAPAAEEIPDEVGISDEELAAMDEAPVAEEEATPELAEEPAEQVDEIGISDEELAAMDDVPPQEDDEPQVYASVADEEEVPAEEPAEETPVEEEPIGTENVALADDEPVSDDTLAEEADVAAPVEEVNEAPAEEPEALDDLPSLDDDIPEETPVKDAPVEEPAEDAVSEYVLAEDIPAEEALAEDIPAEESITEEPANEEIPAEAEEVASEEAPKAAEKPSSFAAMFGASFARFGNASAVSEPAEEPVAEEPAEEEVAEEEIADEEVISEEEGADSDQYVPTEEDMAFAASLSETGNAPASKPKPAAPVGFRKQEQAGQKAPVKGEETMKEGKAIFKKPVAALMFVLAILAGAFYFLYFNVAALAMISNSFAANVVKTLPKIDAPYVMMIFWGLIAVITILGMTNKKMLPAFVLALCAVLFRLGWDLATYYLIDNGDFMKFYIDYNQYVHYFISLVVLVSAILFVVGFEKKDFKTSNVMCILPVLYFTVLLVWIAAIELVGDLSEDFSFLIYLFEYFDYALYAVWGCALLITLVGVHNKDLSRSNNAWLLFMTLLIVALGYVAKYLYPQFGKSTYYQYYVMDYITPILSLIGVAGFAAADLRHKDDGAKR